MDEGGKGSLWRIEGLAITAAESSGMPQARRESVMMEDAIAMHEWYLLMVEASLRLKKCLSDGAKAVGLWFMAVSQLSK